MLDTGLWILDNKECLFVLSSIEYQASSIASPQAIEENAPPLVGLRRSFARRDNSNRRKWGPKKALQLTWARSRALWTSIAPITIFGCCSVVGVVGAPTQLNLIGLPG